MNAASVIFIIAAIAAGVETFQTRSFGWGGVALIAVGLAVGAWS